MTRFQKITFEDAVSQREANYGQDEEQESTAKGLFVVLLGDEQSSIKRLFVNREEVAINSSSASYIEGDWLDVQVPKLHPSQALSEAGKSLSCPLFRELLDNCSQISQTARNA